MRFLNNVFFFLREEGREGNISKVKIKALKNETRIINKRQKPQFRTEKKNCETSYLYNCALRLFLYSIIVSQSFHINNIRFTSVFLNKCLKLLLY